MILSLVYNIYYEKIEKELTHEASSTLTRDISPFLCVTGSPVVTDLRAPVFLFHLGLTLCSCELVGTTET